jgi:hypothetical protein
LRAYWPVTNPLVTMVNMAVNAIKLQGCRHLSAAPAEAADGDRNHPRHPRRAGQHQGAPKT